MKRSAYRACTRQENLPFLSFMLLGVNALSASVRFELPHWLPASLYIDWQPSDVTEGACPAGRVGVSGGGVWGVINEGWNVERKQTRPRRHLSFTKQLSWLTFFPPSPPHPHPPP